MHISNSENLKLLNRHANLFDSDISRYEEKIRQAVRDSSFLVIGGAGSIGSAVTNELFFRNPKRLFVVDISENNLAELVRDLRGTKGHITGEFRTFAIDCGSTEYEAFHTQEGPFDYILNLSALKHVRSERDPYTLMRLVRVNVLNTIHTIDLAIEAGVKKYFCVSTDKAAGPVSMMGASKRIMEMFLADRGLDIPISTARFANVAFSDGSLPASFLLRISKKQPLAAPSDIRRYFITGKESGQLCLLSALFGQDRDIFFPKDSEELNLTTFTSLAEKLLKSLGYTPHLCDTEDEARANIDTLIEKKQWPCCFLPSATTGEKTEEVFYTDVEEVDWQRFNSIGVVKNGNEASPELLRSFLTAIDSLLLSRTWSKPDIVCEFEKLIPDFHHVEKGKSLDDMM